MRYLIVKSMAGIGNRFSTIGEAIHYAIISKRYLIIDWSDHMFSSNKENVFYKYFNVLYDNKLFKHDLLIPVDIPNYQTKSVHPICWTKHLNKTAYDCLKNNTTWKLDDYYKNKIIYSTNKNYRQEYNNQHIFNIHNVNAYKQDILVYTNVVGLHRNRDMNYIIKYIQIKPEYLKIPYSIISTLGNYIAIHIRYTDKKCNYTKALCIINNILHMQSHPNIYVATDSSIIIDKVNRIAKLHNKTEAVHYIIKPLSGSDNNIHYRGDYNKHDKIQDIITEMQILTHSKKLICWDFSTFTWLPQRSRGYKNVVYL